MTTFNCLLAVIFLLGSISFTSAITYNVIASPPSKMNVAVVVDKTVYMLKPEHGILYKGEAPPAKNGYSYAYVDDNSSNSDRTKISESFIRPPLDVGSTSTLNEFFNRSSNTYNIKNLPRALPPLESINRIESNLHIQNQIPTVHIYGDQPSIDNMHKNQKADLDVKLNIAYFGLNDVQVFENAKVSLAGRSTRGYQKVSYAIKFDKKSDSTLFGYKNFKLRSLAKDDSYVRENICYNVFKSAGVPASGFSYVRLFINNQAVGLFGFIETFQDPWTAAVFANGETDYNSGHMYQGYGTRGISKTELVISDLNYEGEDLNRYNYGQYKIKTGPKKKKVESYKGLQEFTKFINESTVQKTAESEWEKVLDMDGILRSMTLADLLGLGDSYLTTANNFYLYKDPRQEYRITYIAADMDTSLGSTFLYNISTFIHGNYEDHPGMKFRPLSKAILAYPSYRKAMIDLRLTLTKNLMNPSVMNPYIDSIVDMIRVDVEWDKRLPKLGVHASHPSRTNDGLVDISNIYEKIKSVVPTGYRFDYLVESPPMSMDAAVDGDYPPNSFLSVKKFIAKKSSAVLEFYKRG